MMLPSRLGCPLSLKTPNMGNPGLDDGRVIRLPDDVQIIEPERLRLVNCIVGRGKLCPDPFTGPKLRRGDSVTWITGDGRAVTGLERDSPPADPEVWSFLTEKAGD